MKNIKETILGTASVLSAKEIGTHVLVGVKFSTQTEELAVITLEGGRAYLGLPVTCGATDGFDIGTADKLDRNAMTALGLLAHELRGTETQGEKSTPGLLNLPARFEALLAYAARDLDEPQFKLLEVHGDGLVVSLDKQEQILARLDLTRSGSLALRMKNETGTPKVIAISRDAEADVIGIPPTERKGPWTNAKVTAQGVTPCARPA